MMIARAAALTTFLLLSPSLALALDAKGTWFTADRETQIRIADCAGALCGHIIWLKQPNDPATGKPKTDKNNAEVSKQNRPIMGVPIVLNMTPAGPDKWRGQVYNASDGKIYSGSITMTGPSTLKLEGCVGAIFCKSQEWTRAN